LFSINDFFFFSYIFYLDVVDITDEFSPFKFFWIICRIVKIYLLRLFEKLL